MLRRIALALVIAAAAAAPQEPALLAEINRIKAIDNHAHPMRVVVPGETPDDEYDALPLEGLEPYLPPLRFRPSNPDYAEARRQLFGPGGDARQRAQKDRGDAYPAWILDRLNIETMLANRVAMGRGLAAPRFLWVPFADALMYPFPSGAGAESPDSKVFYAGEENLLKRYLAEAGVQRLPATLDDYVSRVVTPTLERQKRDGAVAVKFETTYLRPLDIGPASRDDAARIYARCAAGGEPAAAEYKTLQDFLFRFIAREAGRLKLPVHFHTGAGGGSYYRLAGSNPLLLEGVLNDPALRQTQFVLVHGGWPFTKEVAFLLSRPNVWADFSFQSILLHPASLSVVLRGWLEQMPEKVLFATDAFAIGPEAGWEETAWVSAASGRRALAITLTDMVQGGEITRTRALEVARMVLRGNAAGLYLKAAREPVNAAREPVSP